MIEDESDFTPICDICDQVHPTIMPCCDCYNECCSNCRVGNLCIECADVENEYDDDFDDDYYIDNAWD